MIWANILAASLDRHPDFLAGAILHASTNIQQIFSTLSSIADQALFLTDLLAFFEMKPTIQSKANAISAPRPIVHGFEFRNVSFKYPGSRRLILTGWIFTSDQANEWR